MWRKTENSEAVRPPEKELCGDSAIIRRNYHRVAGTEETSEHWTYEEWQMSAEQYEVYQAFETQVAEQADALIELAEIISEIGG